MRDEHDSVADLIDDIDRVILQEKLNQALESTKEYEELRRLNESWPGTPWVPWGHGHGCWGGIYS